MEMYFYSFRFLIKQRCVQQLVSRWPLYSLWSVIITGSLGQCDRPRAVNEREICVCHDLHHRASYCCSCCCWWWWWWWCWCFCCFCFYFLLLLMIKNAKENVMKGEMTSICWGLMRLYKIEIAGLKEFVVCDTLHPIKRWYRACTLLCCRVKWTVAQSEALRFLAQ